MAMPTANDMLHRIQMDISGIAGWVRPAQNLHGLLACTRQMGPFMSKGGGNTGKD
jgi:hypothetical protein